MARRFSAPYLSEPVSALAAWSRRLAIFALITILVSVIVVRFGFLEYRPAVMSFGGALAIAALSILFGLAGFASIWHSGARGVGRIMLALLINAVILAYPAYLGWKYYRLPKIYDITTDPIDPPRFDVLVRLRGSDGANPAAYAGLYSAEQQRKAYPEVDTIQLDIGALKAYEAALALVNKSKWLVVDARAPQAPHYEGHIEAVARTPIMGFREDVAIRVLPDGDGAQVDIRSSSRYFNSDLGSNAARIVKFAGDLTTAANRIAQSRAANEPATPTGSTKTKAAPQKGHAAKGTAQPAKGQKSGQPSREPASR